MGNKSSRSKRAALFPDACGMRKAHSMQWGAAGTFVEGVQCMPQVRIDTFALLMLNSSLQCALSGATAEELAAMVNR